MSNKVFVGVDGCKTGWFAVFLDLENGNNCNWDIGIFPKFQFLIDFLNKKYEKADFLVLIDIPIGLKNGGTGERLSDSEARKLLQSRKSSIFSVPCREAIYAESYEEACNVNEKLTGKRISKQAWNIIPRIRDVDTFLIENEIFREKIKEAAPEICFQAFAGFPMKYSKKTPEGFLERKKVLKELCLFTEEIFETALLRYNRKELAKDDLLDAFVCAITAKMGHFYGFERVPCKPETDNEGIKIQMLYYIPGDVNANK
jgi:predicted RNase H-like nuclease